MHTIVNNIALIAQSLSECAERTVLGDFEVRRLLKQQEFIVNGYIAPRDPWVYERDLVKEELKRSYEELERKTQRLTTQLQGLELALNAADSPASDWQVQRLSTYKPAPFEQFQQFIFRRSMEMLPTSCTMSKRT